MRPVKAIIISVSLLLMISSQGCLNEGFQPEVVDQCDTTTYQRVIRPIILQNCALSGCHDENSTNPDYTKYLDIKKEIDIKVNGVPKLLYRIDLPLSDEEHMPQNGIILSASDRLKIKSWIDNGYAGCDQ